MRIRNTAKGRGAAVADNAMGLYLVIGSGLKPPSSAATSFEFCERTAGFEGV